MRFHPISKTACWFATAQLILLLGGCSGDDGGDLPATVDASGVVLLDGQPVHGASVVFAPVEPGEYPAFSITDERGRFDLKAFEAKGGAVPGSYQVQVTKTIEVEGAPPPTNALGEDAAHAAESPDAGVSWKNALPAQYANPTKSGITIDIPESGVTDLKIELKSTP